ncbi:condensin subunit ScpA [Geosporobacter subterraneus DSM 17957]|uniref:Segregation and condensation protein A n=1 Tax=Geosporobacter subterraneus DSM 17957 TaxID=1121919 RepID=A0A1M6C6E5_9FIRM|nr:segregation/condensation protein A [Geosporobacter subterraneus]SHI56532.1 condensin subunit ScpA [Geosporobacter subterraneus DSM 17957]
MSYNVKLETFEGPFDLLFHLIEKEEVDIYDIPISKITAQYLGYIEEMQRVDLDVASEFLLMAATLIEIKSKMLLPNTKDEQLALDMDDIDPRQDLITRLIEYKKYKNIALELKKREEECRKIFYKPQEQLDEFIKYESNEVQDMNITDLINAVNNIFQKRKNIHVTKFFVNEIKREEISIEMKMKEIRDYLMLKASVRFDELFQDALNKREIIATFIALLELMKLNFIVVQQNNIFGDIWVKRRICMNEVQ